MRRVQQEDLPGIQPLLFRELDHRIARTRLEHQPLPDAFTLCQDEAGEGALVFRGRRYDLNLTLLRRSDLEGSGRGAGVFVVSNGAGVATNTVDQLSPHLGIAGMIDLKRRFTEVKITAALEMVQAARPDLDALVINMISGVAFTRDAAAAVERFCTLVEERVPVLLRFTGPDSDTRSRILEELARRRACVTLADSTRELVDRTLGLFGRARDPSPRSRGIAQRVHDALSVRARLGVTLDPRTWLTPDRAIESVFGSKRRARVGVLGFGEMARFQVRAMREEGVRIRWVVTPTAAKHASTGIPGVRVFPTTRDGVAARGDVDIVLNYAPAPRVCEATHECLQHSQRVRLMLLIAENVRYEQAIRVMDLLEERGVACLGPNSPGVMIVDERRGRADLFKLGNMPAPLFTVPGGMSVIGRSGTVIFDVVQKAGTAGIGTRAAWAIGGDRYTGFGFLESLLMLEQDPGTRVIVLGGESGGIQEQLAARLVATGVIGKPVIALVTGESLPAGVQCGHQGSVKFSEADDPRVKKRHLAEAGVVVVDNPTEVVEAIQEIEATGWDIEQRRREALWEHLVEAGKETGLPWHEGLRPPYLLLYELLGYHPILEGHARSAAHLHDLAEHLATVGADRFRGLLATTLHPETLSAAFGKSREYLGELLRGIHEIGLTDFEDLVCNLFGIEPFQQALAATPWAAADLINEAHEVGIPETQTVVSKTMGTALFRETLAEKPWNTAHAFRSISNMRWWAYVRAYDRWCTHLLGDTQLPKDSWRRDPWASVKLVRLYDRMPDGDLEHAVEDPATRSLFIQKVRTDPQGLLDLLKQARREARATGQRLAAVLSRISREGAPDRPRVEDEIARMEPGELDALVGTVFTREAFERACQDHPHSSARALRLVNHLGDAGCSGPWRLLQVYHRHADKFDTPAFRLAVGRNLWMVVDLLLSADRIDSVSLQRIVDYVLSRATFNYSISEHQWGTAQALRKIAHMGPREFLDAHRLVEDVTRDRECFSAAFRKNPRDAVQIVQVATRLGADALEQLLGDAETREAFLSRVRACPRNAAHFLEEVAIMGVGAFDDFIDRDFGRPLLGAMLQSRGCHLVRCLRRVNIVGITDFRRELRAWRSHGEAPALDPENATEVVGVVKERVLERRLSDPVRRIPVHLPGQPTYRISEGEIRGLYQSYPEWGEVLFKLHGGEPMTAAEQVDLYRLVSGRKRFQTHMVPIVANFLPLRVIRSRITAGEPLIPEIRALRGVPQHEPHRFDAYFHTLEVLDQLVTRVLPLDFVDEELRRAAQAALEEQIDHVSCRDLLLLAAALHDLGKARSAVDDGSDHVQRGLEAAGAILERLGLTGAQRSLVLGVIRHHAPPRLRKPTESWPDFLERGGLDLLYDEITGHGENPHPRETILHYHADILGQQGDRTPPATVERRRQVTSHLLVRHAREQAPAGG